MKNNQEIALPEFSATIDGHTPESLKDDPYYGLNDIFIQQITAVQGEIMELADRMEPRALRIAKLVHKGEGRPSITKAVKCSNNVYDKIHQSFPVQQMLSFLRHLDQVNDVVTERQLKALAWRIAVDNETQEPQIALKAVDTIVKISAPKNAGGQAIQIVINNEMLPQGALDG